MAAYGEANATEGLRKEVVDKAIKQIAARKYKFKQGVTISSSNGWKQTFFRESTDILTGKTGNAVKGIPRGANFPQAVVTWKEINTYIEKYGLEDFIYYEDIKTNDIDVQRRTLYKITEGVVKAVDDQIYTVLTDGGDPIGGSVSDIQTISIANNDAWNGSSCQIVDDLMNCQELIGEAYYDTDNLMLFVNHRDYRSIMNYLGEKGAQWGSVGEQIATNGRVPGVAGIKSIVVSPSVSASRALVVVPKVCATWKETVSLSSDVKEEAFKGTRIRVCEMGVTNLTDPLAVVLITGTEGTGV